MNSENSQKTKAWKTGFWIFLGLIVIANFFIHPHEAEYGLDALPGFWAAFGLIVTVVMVFVMKKIIQPMLARPEEKTDVE